MKFSVTLSLNVLLCLLKWANSIPSPTGVNVHVAESIGLERALASAKPGDRIFLPKDIYPGRFVAKANGTLENPIEIEAKPGTALILGNGKSPVFTISGNHWKMSNLNISNEGDVGLLVSGNHFHGDNLIINKASTGVALEGEENYLVNSTLDNANIGIEIKGATNVHVTSNKIANSKICISIAETSKNGIVDKNKCHGGTVMNLGTVLEKNTEI